MDGEVSTYKKSEVMDDLVPHIHVRNLNTDTNLETSASIVVMSVA